MERRWCEIFVFDCCVCDEIGIVFSLNNVVVLKEYMLI